MTTVYFDYETFLIQPGCAAPPPVCAVYAVDWGAPQLVHAAPDKGNLMALLEGWLRDPAVTIVAHHAPFEVAVTMAWRKGWTGLLFDKLRQGQIKCTLVREKLIRIGRGDPREGFALDACLEAHRIPVSLDKKNPWRVRFGELYSKPISAWPKEAVEYVTGDIAVRDLYQAQARCDPRLIANEDDQVRAAVALQLTSAWGIRTDPAAAATLLSETKTRLEEHKAVVVEAGLARHQRKAGELVLVKDKKAAEARLVSAYARLGRDVPRGAVTEKMAAAGAQEGNVKLDEEACLLSEDPVLQSYTAYSQAGTLLSKVRRLQRSPIQTRYDVLKATGRTSSSQGDDPAPGQAWTAYGTNIQNLPQSGEEVVDPTTGQKTTKPGARECFVARPGWGILSVDYDACELRTWAQVCIWVLGYSDLAEILNNPKRCPHVEMGARLTDRYDENGVTWEEAYRVAYALKALDSKGFKAMRGVAKGPGFGLPGGMAWAKLIIYCRLNYGVIISEELSKKACRVWREIYREAQPYLDWVKTQVGRGFGSKGTITQFVSKRLRGQVGYTDGANGFFQGLAADIAKTAGWRLVEASYEQRQSPLYGCRPLAFVHDEWLYEVPLDRLHEAGYEMSRIMVHTAQEFCPDIRFSASPAAMRRWSKAAGDPCHDAQGRLLCFEDRVH